jgi:hypothetical protein
MIKNSPARRLSDFRAGLKMDWLFGIKSTPQVQDYSGGGWVPSNVGAPTRVYDERLGAYVMKLDNVDAVSIIDSAFMRTPPFTICLLVKWLELPSVLGDWTDIVTKLSTGAHPLQYGITANNANDFISAQICKADGSMSEAISDFPLEKDKWYYIVFSVSDAYVGTLHIDGVEIADKATAGDMTGDPGNFRVGFPGYAGTQINHHIAALRLYDSILTEEQRARVFEVWRSFFGFYVDDKAPLTDSFSDDFSDPFLLDFWDNWGGSNVVVNAGLLEISSSLLAQYYGVRYDDPLDMRSSFVSVKIEDAGNQALATYECCLDAREDDNNFVFISISGGYISFAKMVGGVYTWLANAPTPYSASVHRFFRIREDSGTVYAEFSTDGKTWVVFWSGVVAIDFSSIEAVLRAGCFGVEATTTTAKFAFFNCLE